MHVFSEYDYKDATNTYYYTWTICTKDLLDDAAIKQSGGKNKHGAVLGRIDNARLVGGSKYINYEACRNRGN